MSGLAIILIALAIVLVIFWLTRPKSDPPNQKQGELICIPVGDFLTSQFKALMPLHLGPLNESYRGINIKADNIDIASIQFDSNLTTCDLTSGKAQAKIQLVASNTTFGLARSLIFTEFTLDAVANVNFIKTGPQYTLQSANVTDLNFIGTSPDPTAPGFLGLLNLAKGPLIVIITGVLNSALIGKTFAQPLAKVGPRRPIGFIDEPIPGLPNLPRPRPQPPRPQPESVPPIPTEAISQFLSAQLTAVIEASSLGIIPITGAQTSGNPCLSAEVAGNCLGLRAPYNFAVTSVRGLNTARVSDVRLGSATWTCDSSPTIRIPVTITANASQVRFHTTVSLQLGRPYLAHWEDQATGSPVNARIVIDGFIIGTYNEGITTFNTNNLTLTDMRVVASAPNLGRITASVGIPLHLATFPSTLTATALNIVEGYVRGTVRNAVQSSLRSLNTPLAIPGLMPRCPGF